MNTPLFWQEEIRHFPHGCRAAALWVVRQEGADGAAPIRVLFGWDTGNPAGPLHRGRLPLGPILKAMACNREELDFRDPDTALWIEPLQERSGSVRGCLAVCFQAEEPWREGVF